MTKLEEIIERAVNSEKPWDSDNYPFARWDSDDYAFVAQVCRRAVREALQFAADQRPDGTWWDMLRALAADLGDK